MGGSHTSICMDMTTGNTKDLDTRDELLTLGSEEWHVVKSLMIRFRIPATTRPELTAGSASITLTPPRIPWADGGVRYYLNSNSPGAVLALERTIREVFRASRNWYGVLSRDNFWFLCSFCSLVPLEIGNRLLDQHRIAGSAVTTILVALAFIAAICTIMFVGGAKKLFPKVIFAIGDKPIAALRAEHFRRQLVKRLWDLVKITCGAVLGALAVRYWK